MEEKYVCVGYSERVCDKYNPFCQHRGVHAKKHSCYMLAKCHPRNKNCTCIPIDEHQIKIERKKEERKIKQVIDNSQ